VKTIEEHLKKMVDLFGELPDPVNQPAKFKFLLEVYKYFYYNEFDEAKR
jgi:hypothetical protein